MLLESGWGGALKKILWRLNALCLSWFIYIQHLRSAYLRKAWCQNFKMNSSLNCPNSLQGSYYYFRGGNRDPERSSHLARVPELLRLRGGWAGLSPRAWPPCQLLSLGLTAAAVFLGLPSCCHLCLSAHPSPLLLASLVCVRTGRCLAWALPPRAPVLACHVVAPAGPCPVACLPPLHRHFFQVHDHLENHHFLPINWNSRWHTVGA